MSLPETGPALRRYFVNTMFDSTFAVLGIIIGSALTADADQGLVIATIITSCVALAISTGSSVYEAETLEQSRRMDEIGRAMLRRWRRQTLERLPRPARRSSRYRTHWPP